MNHYRWAALGIAALLVSCTNPKRTSMASETAGLQVSELQSAPAGSFISLRMVSDRQGISIAGMTASSGGMHEVSLLPLEGPSFSDPKPAAKLASPFGKPFWDAVSTLDGINTVWTMPGSAICPLGFQAPGKPQDTLTRQYRRGVFQGPRFVRGKASVAVTATAVLEEGGTLVLFPEGLENGQSRYRTLPAAGTGRLLDGLLIRQGDGYLLLARYTAAGEGAERPDLRGESLMSGVLRGLWLDSEFQPIDSVFSPLGDSAVFEFDADAGGERIYLAATTPEGWTAAAAVAVDKAWRWFRTPEFESAGSTLFTPALSAQGPSATVALLSADETRTRHILHGKISFAP